MTDSVEPPGEIKLFPIRGCILPPGEYLPLNVFEPRYLNMIDDAMAGDRYIGMVQTVEGGAPDHPRLERVGTAGRIVSHEETGDGRYLIVLEGVMRFLLAQEIDPRAPYREACTDYRPYAMDLIDVNAEPNVEKADYLDHLKRYFNAVGIDTDWRSVERAPLGLVINKTVMAAPLSAFQKQSLLEAPSITDRANQLYEYMNSALSRGDQNSQQ